MIETALIAIAATVALWSAILVITALYLDDSVKTAELGELLYSLSTLLAEKGKNNGSEVSRNLNARPEDMSTLSL